MFSARLGETRNFSNDEKNIFADRLEIALVAIYNLNRTQDISHAVSRPGTICILKMSKLGKEATGPGDDRNDDLLDYT